MLWENVFSFAGDGHGSLGLSWYTAVTHASYQVKSMDADLPATEVARAKATTTVCI